MATLAADLPALRELTPRQRVLRRLARRRGAMLGLGVVVFFVVLALLAPTIAPHDPLQTSWSEVRKAPSAAHLFGTDEIGRDVTSRVIWGARASLLAGLVSVCISLSLGVPIGMLAGYLGRWVDAHLPRSATLAVNDIGAIAYFSRRPVIDLMGLVTPEIRPYRRAGEAGVLRFVAERCPDFVIVFPTWFPEMTARRELLTPIYRVRLDRNEVSGGPEMVVYRLARCAV